MSCTVNEDVVRVLKDFHKAKKPIGLCCIAPVLAAKVLGNVVITLGKKGKKQLFVFIIQPFEDCLVHWLCNDSLLTTLVMSC